MAIREILEHGKTLSRDIGLFIISPRSLIQRLAVGDVIPPLTVLSVFTAIVGVIFGVFKVSLSADPFGSIDWKPSKIVINGVDVSDSRPQLKHVSIANEFILGVDARSYVIVEPAKDGSLPCVLSTETRGDLHNPRSYDEVRHLSFDERIATYMKSEDAIKLAIDIKNFVSSACNGSYFYMLSSPTYRIFGYSADYAALMNSPVLIFPWTDRKLDFSMASLVVGFGAISSEFIYIVPKDLTTPIVAFCLLIGTFSLSVSVFFVIDRGSYRRNKRPNSGTALKAAFHLSAVLALLALMLALATVGSSHLSGALALTKLIPVVAYLLLIVNIFRFFVHSFHWRSLAPSMLRFVAWMAVSQVCLLIFAAPIVTAVLLFPDIFSSLIK